MYISAAHAADATVLSLRSQHRSLRAIAATEGLSQVVGVYRRILRDLDRHTVDIR